jgi:hypothetical protein
MYALGQVAGNLPTILTVGGTLIGGGIDKIPIPSPAKKLLKGAVAGTLLVIAHNGSSPANPADSAVQKALRGVRGHATGGVA